MHAIFLLKFHAHLRAALTAAPVTQEALVDLILLELLTHVPRPEPRPDAQEVARLKAGHPAAHYAALDLMIKSSITTHPSPDAEKYFVMSGGCWVYRV
jgi:hypothetical protein